MLSALPQYPAGIGHTDGNWTDDLQSVQYRYETWKTSIAQKKNPRGSNNHKARCQHEDFGIPDYSVSLHRTPADTSGGAESQEMELASELLFHPLCIARVHIVKHTMVLNICPPLHQPGLKVAKLALRLFSRRLFAVALHYRWVLPVCHWIHSGRVWWVVCSSPKDACHRNSPDTRTVH